MSTSSSATVSCDFALSSPARCISDWERISSPWSILFGGRPVAPLCWGLYCSLNSCLPMASVAPGSTRRSVTLLPLTLTPLVLRKSRAYQYPSDRTNLQCCPETLLKLRTISHDLWRPMTYSVWDKGKGSPPPVGDKRPYIAFSTFYRLQCYCTMLLFVLPMKKTNRLVHPVWFCVIVGNRYATPSPVLYGQNTQIDCLCSVVP